MQPPDWHARCERARARLDNSRERKARKWAWIEEHEPELAALLREMREEGLNPGEPIIERYRSGE